MARKRTQLGASLTRTHFVEIGNLLCEENASDRLVQSFASFFKRMNPRFDNARFIQHVDRCKRGR